MNMIVIIKKETYLAKRLVQVEKDSDEWAYDMQRIK